MTTKPESKQEKVRRQLLAMIRKRKPHDALPNERLLAEQLGVSRMTLRNARAGLIDEGLLYSVHGAGTFVAEARVTKEVLLSSFSEDMLRRGLTPSSQVLAAQVMSAPETAARALELEPLTDVYNLERLRMADGVPVCLEDTYLPTEAVPGLLKQPYTGSLYAILREHYQRPVVRASTTVSAIALNKRQAELLHDRLRAPALRFERVGFDQRGFPLEYCVTVYRSGRFDLRYTVDMDR